MNLPADYRRLMKDRLQDDYGSYQKSFEHTIGQTFRVNNLKAEPAEVLRRLHAVIDKSHFRPVDWCQTGFYFDGDERLSLLPYYHAGLYYLQEPSAMAPASFLPVEAGERVLDLCAAPGGKTTALAAKLSGRGLLVANDISISRCKALQKNVQMAGISNAVITCSSPHKLAEHFPEYFDKILVDAPCSGEGMFRRDPAMVKSWSLSEVSRYSQLQKEILSQAASMLKPGGCLLYSTCTYSPEENEQVVETLLAREDFSLLPLPDFDGVDRGHPEWSLSKDPTLYHCRRFWNHKVKGEGQFAALFQKAERAGEDDRGKAAYKTEPARDRKKNRNKDKRRGKGREEKGTGYEVSLTRAGEFFSHINAPDLADSLERLLSVGRIIRIEERLFLLPEGAPDLSALRVVSSGLYLGDVKKNRFEPSGALAMALKADQFDNVLRLSPQSEELEKYLRCETIEGAVHDGWCLVCVEEFPLGWGKARGGRIKNRYPAGWRKQ